MWRFVQERGNFEELQDRWQQEIRDHQRRHGPFRGSLLQPRRTWTIKVLCYAISNYAQLETTPITRRALRFLSNIPIALEIEDARYVYLMQQLRQSYVTLLGDELAQAYIFRLNAIDRKKYYTRTRSVESMSKYLSMVYSVLSKGSFLH